MRKFDLSFTERPSEFDAFSERRQQRGEGVAPELQQEGRRQVGLPHQDIVEGVEQTLRLGQEQIL